MIKMSRKAKKAMAVALTAGMLASTAATPVMAATEGWKKNSTGWWYQNADGSWPANKWEKINGSWYYFDANGYMKANSWAQDASGKWYYLGVNGAMKVNSWAQDASGKWYFVGADGAMKANSWTQDASGKWYFLGADGAMVTNTWAKDSSNLWYYLGADGVMEAGKWITVGDKSYFLAADGVMQSGVIKVEGKTYYLGGNDEGWMQTGKINIASTEYNFGTDGACTDEKAPAAAKNFDKKGNEIAPEVEIEAVDGITGTITNALPDYQETYGNVLIAGKDAYLKVLVSDKDGKPVANTPVALRVEESDVASYTPNGEFKEKGLSVQTTDANGYATFVIGASSSKITPTSGDYALLKLTATAVATNQKYETSVAFATISLGSVGVVDSATNIVKSTNASESVVAVPTTYTIDGKAKTEYVATQQVNEKNSTNHKVVFGLDPMIRIPYANASNVIDKYQKDVNKDIKEYSVYNHGTEEIVIEDIPAGLKYATLNFSSIDISEYTKVEIYAYPSGASNKGEPYIIDGPITQKNFGYQIPVQDNKELDICVKVISEGQVDDDQNSGLVITDVTGLYDTEKTDNTKDLALADSVTWSVVENKYSNAKTLTADQAKAYIPGDADAKYTDEGNTYSYQVPVYPYSGNAILTVKDVNKKVVGYFTIPTINKNKEDDYWVGADGFQNENILVGANHQAILVSYDEAFNNVGTITQKGNKVEVNSETTGVTALQAKINIKGYEEQINLTNNTVYTSVHWSPIPSAEAAIESQDFYALVGQNITVKAQLVDNNGNKVSQSGERITYIYGENNTIDGLGAIPDTRATATVYTSTTDANGQATLKITSGDPQALVDLLHAESDKYNVQLVIGDTVVTNANLRWVEVGLSFTDSADEDSTTTNTLDGVSEVKELGKLKKDVGSNWIMGYEVVGDTQDDTTYTRWVDSMVGVKVDVSKGGAGEITTAGMDNGVAKITSTKSGATTLTGTINENSVVSGTDVVFKVAIDKDHDGKDIVYKEYKNVGEGTPSINSSLNIPISWGNVGTQIEIIAPKGISMVVNKDDETPGEEEVVYVKVTDSFGNEINDKDIEVSVTYSDGETTVKGKADGTEAPEETPDVAPKDGIADALKVTTGADGLGNGLVKVILPEEIGGITPTTATITAKVGNETTQKTINYKKDANSAVKFAIGDIVYEAQTSSSNPKVRVIFTTPVNKDTLNVDMFTIKKEEYEIPIAKAELDPSHANEVILTIDNQYANGLTNETDYEVTIAPKTVKGITYELCDSYYRTFDGNTEDGNMDDLPDGVGYFFDVNGDSVEELTNTFTTADAKLADAREAVEEAVEAVKEAAKAAAELAAAKAAAQSALDGATIAVPAVAAFGINADVTIADVDGYDKKVEVTLDDNDIFADNNLDDTKLAIESALPAANSTATFTVTYTHEEYGDVTRTVKYNAEVNDDQTGITIQVVAE